MARGPRVVKHCCIGFVLNRFMKEANLTFRDIQEATGIPKSTLFGYTVGVFPENPDILIPLKKYFSALFKIEISTDDLLFGKDEDRLAMAELIKDQEKEIKELTRQLCFFQIAERMNV